MRILAVVLISILLAYSNVSAFMVISSRSGGAPPAGPTPDLLNETFDSAGYDETAAWNGETLTGAATMDEDYTTVKQGTQSLQIGFVATQDSYNTADFTATNNDLYFNVSFYAESWTTDWQNLDFLQVSQQPQDYQCLQLYCRSNGSLTQCYLADDDANTGTTDLTSLANGTWHTVQIWYDYGSTMKYKVNGGSEVTIAGGTMSRNCDRVRTGEAAASATASIVIDDVEVCSNATDCGY